MKQYTDTFAADKKENRCEHEKKFDYTITIMYSRIGTSRNLEGRSER